MITVLCCYNDAQMLAQMLEPSLKEQSTSCQRYFLDASQMGCKSAAETYNLALDNPIALGNPPSTDFLLFVHQDLALADPYMLEKLEQKLEENPFAILGLAGINRDGLVYSNLRYRDDSHFIVGHQLKEAMEVESVDECCFAMRKALWEEIRFDEENCDHWHLYAVDFCYAARRKIHSQVLALPLAAFHKQNALGGLETDSHFLSTLWKLTRKYRSDFPSLFAPCYVVPTALPASLYHILRTRLKNSLKRGKACT